MAMKQGDKFLRQHSLYYNDMDFDAIVELHKIEIKNAISGRKSSLSAIPSRCFSENLSLKPKNVIAVDSGGTNLRVALIAFDSHGEPLIERQDKYLFPFSGKNATSEEFFTFIADKIKFYTEYCNIEHIGVSCAYNSIINNERDAVIDGLGKEMRVSDIKGKRFAFELKKHITQNNGIKIVCLNDTAASMIGSLNTKLLLSGSFCCGLVVGTGMNTCYKQPKGGILSPKNGLCDIIVTEAAYFNKVKRSTLDEKLDNESSIPGDHVYEKMIGGKYLPVLFSLCMRQAYTEGYLSEDRYTEQKQHGSQLDEILFSSLNGRDDIFAREVLAGIIKRAAMFSAANIAAYSVLSECDKVYVSCEGTTVNKLAGFKDSLTDYLNYHLIKKEGIGYELQSCEDSVIKGAAKAVLM